MLETGLPGPADDVQGAAGGVRAVQDLQHPRRGGLHSQRQPGVAGGPQRGQQLGVGRLRVGLGGDLGVRAPGRTAPGPRPATGSAGRRRPATGCRRRRTPSTPRAGRRPSRSTFAARSISASAASSQESRGRRRAQLARRVGVEIAIPAAGRAERDVQVERQAAVRPSRRRPDPAATRRRGPGRPRAGWMAPVQSDPVRRTRWPICQ